MHCPLTYSALGLAFLSLFLPASSLAAPRLAARQARECKDDTVYEGLWSNLLIKSDVNTFCASLLGLTPEASCVAYTTSTRTEYGAITETRTTTKDTIVASSTATVTETATNFELKKRQDQLTARAMITKRTVYLQSAMEAVHALAKRDTASKPDYEASISSGCACGPPDPGTTPSICSASPKTITQRGFKLTTVFVSVTSGVTTVTETVNLTSKINTTSYITPTSTWTIGDWDGVWSDWTTLNSMSTTDKASQSTASQSTSIRPQSSSTKTSTMAESPWSTSSQTSSITGGPWSTSITRSSTAKEVITDSRVVGNTTTATSHSATSTTSKTITTSYSATVSPTSCPGKNGTIFASNPKKCIQYEYICGRTYAPVDFYDIEAGYDTPEECTMLCDAQNRAMDTPCVGIVWNTSSTDNNCRTLRSNSSPIDGDPASVALILLPNHGCYNSSSTTGLPYSTSMATTTSFSIATSWTTSPYSSTPKTPTTTIHYTNKTSAGPYSTPSQNGISSTFQQTSTRYTGNTTTPPYPTGSWFGNGTWTGSWTGSSNYTKQLTTSTQQYTTTNGTATQNLTWTYTTSSTAYSTPYTNPANETSTTTSQTICFGTGVISPSSMSNTTCSVKTVTSATTVYATLFESTTITHPKYITVTVPARNHTNTVTVTFTQPMNCTTITEPPMTVTATVTDPNQTTTITTTTKTVTKKTATVTEWETTTSQCPTTAANPWRGGGGGKWGYGWGNGW